MSPLTNTSHVLIIPGSFCPPHPLYDPLITALHARGISASTMQLPSVQPISPASLRSAPASMYDDAAAIAHEVSRLTQLLRPPTTHPSLSSTSTPTTQPWRGITLLAHSYAGIPASQAFERGAIPSTSVRHLIYLAAVVPALNTGLRMPGFSVVPPGVTIEEDGYMVHTDPAASAPRVWSSLSVEEAVRVGAGEFAAHSARSFTDLLTYPGWRDVLRDGEEGRSVTYIRCTEDQTVPPQGQADMVEGMNAVVQQEEEAEAKAEAEGAAAPAEDEVKKAKKQGNRVVVHNLKADHMPINTATNELADVVAKIARA